MVLAVNLPLALVSAAMLLAALYLLGVLFLPRFANRHGDTADAPAEEPSWSGADSGEIADRVARAQEWFASVDHGDELTKAAGVPLTAESPDDSPEGGPPPSEPPASPASDDATGAPDQPVAAPARTEEDAPEFPWEPAPAPQEATEDRSADPTTGPDEGEPMAGTAGSDATSALDGPATQHPAAGDADGGNVDGGEAADPVEARNLQMQAAIDAEIGELADAVRAAEHAAQTYSIEAAAHEAVAAGHEAAADEARHALEEATAALELARADMDRAQRCADEEWQRAEHLRARIASLRDGRVQPAPDVAARAAVAANRQLPSGHTYAELAGLEVAPPTPDVLKAFDVTLLGLPPVPHRDAPETVEMPAPQPAPAELADIWATPSAPQPEEHEPAADLTDDGTAHGDAGHHRPAEKPPSETRPSRRELRQQRKARRLADKARRKAERTSRKDTDRSADPDRSDAGDGELGHPMGPPELTADEVDWLHQGAQPVALDDLDTLPVATPAEVAEPAGQARSWDAPAAVTDDTAPGPADDDGGGFAEDQGHWAPPSPVTTGWVEEPAAAHVPAELADGWAGPAPDDDGDLRGDAPDAEDTGIPDGTQPDGAETRAARRAARTAAKQARREERRAAREAERARRAEERARRRAERAAARDTGSETGAAEAELPQMRPDAFGAALGDDSGADAVLGEFEDVWAPPTLEDPNTPVPVVFDEPLDDDDELLTDVTYLGPTVREVDDDELYGPTDTGDDPGAEGGDTRSRAELEREAKRLGVSVEDLTADPLPVWTPPEEWDPASGNGIVPVVTPGDVVDHHDFDLPEPIPDRAEALVDPDAPSDDGVATLPASGRPSGRWDA